MNAITTLRAGLTFNQAMTAAKYGASIRCPSHWCTWAKIMADGQLHFIVAPDVAKTCGTACDPTLAERAERWEAQP